MEFIIWYLGCYFLLAPEAFGKKVARFHLAYRRVMHGYPARYKKNARKQ
ncbi:MAG: hypothetical protein J0I79_16525 [Mesorhizobium sp.]|nr:hypothetical protein [Mesorhizobium sp.]MBN9219552.1 hypothetical protein [Mesorhizobium sp.]